MSSNLYPTIKVIDYKGYRISISYDEYPDSPAEWDLLGNIYESKHGNSDLTTESSFTTYDLFENENELGIDSYDEDYEEKVITENLRKNYIYLQLNTQYYSNAGPYRLLCEETDDPLNLFGERSHNPFGIIAVRKSKVEHEYGNLSDETIQTVKNILRNEVQSFEDYWNGEVYYFKIEKHVERTADNPEGLNEIDSCGGYYPNHNHELREDDYDYIINEAKSEIDCILDNLYMQQFKQAIVSEFNNLGESYE